MSAVTGRNTRRNGTAAVAPRRADGSVYPLAMLYNAGALIAYAANPAELLDVLIPGHSGLAPQAALEARIRFAVKVQAVTQARLNAHADRSSVRPSDWAVLNGPRHVPPAVAVWSCPVPLVLVDMFYAPFTDVPVPEGSDLLWLRPADEWEFLVSAQTAGFIVLQRSLD